MVKDFTREDLIELYMLVMQKYGTNRPEDAYDRVLWSDLRTMFDPPLNEDAIWSLPLQQKMINWRYYPNCAVHCLTVHCLTLDASTIYMLADRKYPLSKDACQVMLKMKLLDGTMDEVCYQLLKMIEKQAGIRNSASYIVSTGRRIIIVSTGLVTTDGETRGAIISAMKGQSREAIDSEWTLLCAAIVPNFHLPMHSYEVKNMYLMTLLNLSASTKEDNVQAMMDADYELAVRLQAEEQGELTIEENPICRHGELVKGGETRTEGSSKRAREELESENLKKQKLDENVEAEVDDDQEEAEMKKHIEIVPDDEVAIDAIPLSTKPLIIVDWKIIKEGKMGYF
ncbi:hypothetical protein Tco_1156402 [Tanacetum coccineum]